MSQNNNSEGVGFAFVIAIIGVTALILYAMFVFVAVALTIPCLFALNSTLSIGPMTITPHEARAYIGRGLIGMILLPVFAIFCELMFGVVVSSEYLPHLLAGGYAAGSLGIAMLMEEQEDTASNVTIIPPHQHIAPPRERAEPQRPFEFASWNDEDGR